MHFRPEATTSRRNGTELRRSNPVADGGLDRPIPSFIAPPLVLVEDVTGVDEVYPRERSELVSRVVNLTVAIIALFVTLPVTLLVALAVRLTSRGPVFYSQKFGLASIDDSLFKKGSHGRRVYDHGGRLFTMYKFRTMCVDAEADGKAVWAQKSDPRTTPVGQSSSAGPALTRVAGALQRHLGRYERRWPAPGTPVHLCSAPR